MSEFTHCFFAFFRSFEVNKVFSVSKRYKIERKTKNSGPLGSRKSFESQKDMKLPSGLRKVHTQAILFMKSMSERGGSDMERL